MTGPKEEKPTATVPTGRFARLSKLGGTATTVTARHAFQRLKDVVSTAEQREVGHREATAKSAQDVVKTLAQMKGAAMKVGQLLSIDPQILPPEIRDALGTLQQNAPPMPWEVVEREVSAALGGGIGDHFSEFEKDPLGAASIGQVHRAVTRAGQRVAVKVQYPGIADTIDSDVKNLGSVLQMAKLVLPGARIEDYLEELRQVLHKEADYTQEAQNLVHYAKVFSVFSYARVPKPYLELTRRNVLTMEMMEGRKFDAVLEALSPSDRDALATRFLDMFMRMFHELSTLHADPHPGNFLVDGDGNIILLDFGCVREFEPAFADAFTNVMRAQWKANADRLVEYYQKAGFLIPKGLDGEVLYEWQDIVLEPFLKAGPFDFANWKLEQKAFAFLKDNMVLKLMAPPRPALFYFRVCAGIRGMLSRTGARVDVHGLAKALDKRLVAVGR